MRFRVSKGAQSHDLTRGPTDSDTQNNKYRVYYDDVSIADGDCLAGFRALEVVTDVRLSIDDAMVLIRSEKHFGDPRISWKSHARATADVSP
jgi:hypothetical protein